MTDINELLAERGKTHGDYMVHAEISQQFKELMRSFGEGWGRCNTAQREALEMIAHKIGRILAGNPHFKDHWDDIAGYAKLVADRVSMPAIEVPKTVKHMPVLAYGSQKSQ
jgi:hypothetical protein